MAAPRLAVCQRGALLNLAKAYGRVPDISSDMSDSEAFAKLRKTRTGYSEFGAAAGDFAVYRKGAVSLPRQRAGGVPLRGASPAPLRDILMDAHRLLRPCEQAAQAVADLNLTPAFDPVLGKRGKEYGSLLEDLI